MNLVPTNVRKEEGPPVTGFVADLHHPDTGEPVFHYHYGTREVKWHQYQNEMHPNLPTGWVARSAGMGPEAYYKLAARNNFWDHEVNEGEDKPRDLLVPKNHRYTDEHTPKIGLVYDLHHPDTDEPVLTYKDRSNTYSWHPYQQELHPALPKGKFFIKRTSTANLFDSRHAGRAGWEHYKRVAANDFNDTEETHHPLSEGDKSYTAKEVADHFVRKGKYPTDFMSHKVPEEFHKQVHDSAKMQRDLSDTQKKRVLKLRTRVYGESIVSFRKFLCLS